jgi:hypothetical protein
MRRCLPGSLQVHWSKSTGKNRHTDKMTLKISTREGERQQVRVWQMASYELVNLLWQIGKYRELHCPAGRLPGYRWRVVDFEKCAWNIYSGAATFRP